MVEGKKEEMANNETAISEPQLKKTLIDFLSSQDRLEQIDYKVDLEDIFHLIEQRKPLYQRWTQQAGGKERQLSVPKKPVRAFMENYLLNLVKQKKAHERCHGGEPGWSPKKSLETHLPCSSTLSFDLKSAFENVPFERVFNLFYDLLPETFAHEPKQNIANFFSLLCTINYADRRGDS